MTHDTDNQKPSELVRVRFAPSPTGPLHIGSVRTALFSYIHSLQNKGEFILRFEDTDKDRSEAVFEESIRKGLRWVGIKWDEEYYQSKRMDVYKKYLKILEDKDLTYKHDGGIYFRLSTDNKKIIIKIKLNSSEASVEIIRVFYI